MRSVARAAVGWIPLPITITNNGVLAVSVRAVNNRSQSGYRQASQEIMPAPSSLAALCALGIEARGSRLAPRLNLPVCHCHLPQPHDELAPAYFMLQALLSSS